MYHLGNEKAGHKMGKNIHQTCKQQFPKELLQVNKTNQFTIMGKGCEQTLHKRYMDDQQAPEKMFSQQANSNKNHNKLSL